MLDTIAFLAVSLLMGLACVFAVLAIAQVEMSGSQAIVARE
jgi:hypothetical protein